MMAASLVGIAPVLLVFIFLQKYIVEGLTAGAVKN
jgi:multiple sugar transport system permease protein